MVLSNKTQDMINPSEDLVSDGTDFNRYFINISPTFFISLSHDARVSFISDELLCLLGYSIEEVLGKDFISLFIPENESEPLKRFFRNFKGNTDKVFFENHMIAKDGRELTVKCQWWQIVDSNNKPDFFYGVGNDITECIMAQDILKKKEVRYRVLEENLTDLIWTLNMDLRLTYISSSVSTLLGYSVHEILGYPLERILDRDSIETFKMALPGIFSFGKSTREDIKKTLSIELKLLHKKTYKVPTESKIKVIYNEEGKQVGILGVTRDISDRKNIEKEKERMYEQLLHAQKMEAIGRLAGGIAHDFNNLLVVIMGNIDLLSLKLPKDSPLFEYVNEIKATTSKAASLTKQLLSFSHKQILQPKTLDLNILVSEIEKMLRRLIGENINLKTTFAPTPTIIKADPTQISQVIMNLVLNARDSMPNGGNLIIKTEHKNILDIKGIVNPDVRMGEFVSISVQDNGIGIKEEIIEKIFEPFYTTKKRGEGTGLGLSVVYGIVKQHNGWIDISSKEGVGTTANVFLPLSPLLEEEERINSHLVTQGRGERILLVEDEALVRKCISSVLRNNNYHTFSTSNASEALMLFKEKKGGFDLALIDLVLTDEDGLQLIDKLRSIKPDLKILLTSGYITKKSHWLIIREKGFPFIQKPYEADQLLNIIRGILDDKKLGE